VYPALVVPPQPAAAAPPRALALPWPAILAGAAIVLAAGAWLVLRSHAPGTVAAPPPTALHRIAPAVPPASLPSVASAAPAPAGSGATPGTAQDFDRLATAAEQALLSGDLPEATRLTAAARALDPNHVRVRFLDAQIAREQARLNARHRAAGSAPGPAAQLSRGLATATAMPGAPAASGPASPAAANGPDAATPAGSAPGLPPSSTPPASEARDRNSVAAVILHRVYSVDPDFPDAAREHDLSGYVDLEFTVQADGKVTDVTVLKAQPVGVFERSAIAAVKQWRYLPISRNGAPTTERARLRLNFAYK
jgi:protein TonB